MSVTAVVLAYYEPGWTEATLRSLYESAVEPDALVVVDRAGIGNMAAAFNSGMAQVRTEWAWMLTNVAFEPWLLGHLLNAAAQLTEVAAIHAPFGSEHPHMATEGALLERVPFVEWTAPLVHMAAWDEIGPLDEAMPYWGMDIDWCYRARIFGWLCYVARHAELQHTYLRNVNGDHPATRARKVAKALSDAQTERRLREKYGDDWLAQLWPTHPFVERGRKAIHL